MEHLKEQKMYPIKWRIEILLLLFFIFVSSYFGMHYYRLFHIVVEVFSSFIAFSILITAINTYEISKNIPFLFLGVAFGFAGGFNVIHVIASNGMGFFQGDTTNLSMILSIVQRYVTAVSILVCCRLLEKSYKIVTPVAIIIGFFIISAFLLASIFLWGNFPACFSAGNSTPFKIASEYLISAITIISSLMLYKGKKYIETKVFILLQLYFYAAILCNILLTFYTVQQEISNVLAHVLKVISFYCVYRAIVKVGLKTPYKLLFNELNRIDDSLKQKDSELKQVFSELQKESELRKNIEEMFLKNEVSYKLLIENSPDAIIIYNQEKIVFANESAAHLAGMEKQEKLLGKKAECFFKMNTEDTLDTGFEKRSGEDIIAPAYETQVVSIDGKTTPTEVTNAYITFHNEPAVLSLIRDITQHKQMQKMKKDVEEDKKLLNEALEFNRLITEFFSNISHELRTPLNVILSALQVLSLEEHQARTTITADKKTKYIQMMKQNCYRLLRLINNLIDITRLDSGYVKPYLQNQNIISVVEDITMSVAEYVKEKGIELTFDTNIEEKIIACDMDKIERIMLNLISNAVKFSDTGDHISVEIFDQKESVQICVKDTGIGIPEDKFQVIFERFRQVDNSLSRNHEGSGIGLSLVKALVEMHNGTIEIKSKLGEGSVFIITLPVRILDEEEVAENKGIYRDNSEKVSIEFSDI